MKRFLALLVTVIQLFPALPVYADPDFCLVPPTVGALTTRSYRAGGTYPTCSVILSPAAACQEYATSLQTQNPAGNFTVHSLTFDYNYGFNPASGLTVEGYMDLYGMPMFPTTSLTGWVCEIYSNGNWYVTPREEVTGCNPRSCHAGFVLDASGQNCVSAKIQKLDDEEAHAGWTVTRDGANNVQSITSNAHPTQTWTVLAVDGWGNMTEWRDPYGATYSANYYPGTSKIYQLTTTEGVTTVLWNEAGKMSRVRAPDGNVWRVDYTDKSGIVAPLPGDGKGIGMTISNIKIQTSRGDCGTGRSGTLVPGGAPITPLIIGDSEETDRMYAGVTESAQPVQLQVPFAVIVALGEAALIAGTTYVGAKILMPAFSKAVTAVTELCTNAVPYAQTPEGKKEQAQEDCKKILDAERAACGPNLFGAPQGWDDNLNGGQGGPVGTGRDPTAGEIAHCMYVAMCGGKPMGVYPEKQGYMQCMRDVETKYPGGPGGIGSKLAPWFYPGYPGYPCHQ